MTGEAQGYNQTSFSQGPRLIPIKTGGRKSTPNTILCWPLCGCCVCVCELVWYFDVSSNAS